MVSSPDSFVLLYLHPTVMQAISKKAGKKAAAPQKTGGGGGKVAKVCCRISNGMFMSITEAVSLGGLEGGLQEEAGRRVGYDLVDHYHERGYQ